MPSFPESKFLKRRVVLKCDLPFIDAAYEIGSVSIDGNAIMHNTIRLIMFNGTCVKDFTKPSEQYAELLQEVDEYLEGEQIRLNPAYVESL